jgi:hypothetical protein
MIWVDFPFWGGAWTEGAGWEKRPAKTQYGTLERIISPSIYGYFGYWGTLCGLFIVG